MTTDLTPEIAQQRMLAVLDAAGAEYKRFTHRPIRNFDDADLARQESGFEGTETKSMVITSGNDAVVYLTLIGKRVDLKALRARLGGPKPKFASDDLLASRFAAEPGAAYPFGFDDAVDIYVDPAVYGEDWVLMSAVLPTETLQIRGADLPKVFASLPNTVEEAVFNQE